MQYKFLDDEIEFMKGYRASFKNDVKFFVRFYEIWDNIMIVDQETGLVRKESNNGPMCVIPHCFQFGTNETMGIHPEYLFRYQNKVRKVNRKLAILFIYFFL